MIIRPPTLARIPTLALVGCIGYWVEYGVLVPGTNDRAEDRVSGVDPASVGVTLWSGVVPNPLKTAWFQTA